MDRRPCRTRCMRGPGLVFGLEFYWSSPHKRYLEAPQFTLDSVIADANHRQLANQSAYSVCHVPSGDIQPYGVGRSEQFCTQG